MKIIQGFNNRSLLLLCVLVIAATDLRAALVDTFDGPLVPATAGQGGEPPPPTITAGGPTGSFLNLLAGVNSQGNRYTYDRTDVGAFDTITASFDFRILPGTAGLADGFSFLLIPTAEYGTSGDGPSFFTAEEPNVLNAFGLAFDVYPGINNVSAHWNGIQQAEYLVPQNDAAGLNFRGNNVFNRAELTLQRVGNGTNATVTLIPDSLSVTPGTPYLAFQIVMPNMLPYENRVQFTGRTGGENLSLDLDNVNVTYANPFTGLAAAPTTGHLYQDFDRAGTTSYRAIQFNRSDVNTFRPGPLIKPAEPGSSGAYMQLVSDGVNGQQNHIAFERAMDGGASNMTEVLNFDVRFSSSDTPADGLGILFLPTRLPGTAGITSSEEPNHPGILGIGFDIYTNGAGDPAPAISVHWNSIEVADVPITDPAIGLNQFHRVEVIREPVAGGVNVSVNGIADINGVPGLPVPLVTNVFVAGASNYDYRMEFTARTGGADASHDIDNIVTAQLPRVPLQRTETNFVSGQGSGWKGYRSGIGLAPEIKNDATPNGNYLRLVHDTNNGQQNSVAFDRQQDGNAAAGTGVTADFDFRITNAAGEPADGFSMLLIPTSLYGTTGPGAAATVPGFVAEKPNAPGVFGVGFDVYNEGGDFNEASLHYDGTLSASQNIDPAAINLDAGVFHHARLELRLNAGVVLATLRLTPNVFGAAGTPVTVFQDQPINGMSLYDYRVEFAGRTGGLDISVDLDNIFVQTVPEPGSAWLLVAGAAFFAARRRRSCV